ncbi:RHTO0S06e04126g1_1 [Rhodotorula toruloides]|uniref:RHTO0S06e04126g1_1 n=2 Tax=Rhodotorula toruloides TaxID=5286 RepID=A0A061AVL2_RHOTO|nr:tyrosyl-tRNA synthetase [Rhodotorula toruloides NP11]EMS24170.1 tyrosyl-tRNA synthetase [Rhodotorula toruloides NP11]CDR41676.1 RHTO0S06e04126g1_1 [Rhodotorula toruloides]
MATARAWSRPRREPALSTAPRPTSASSSSWNRHASRRRPATCLSFASRLTLVESAFASLTSARIPSTGSRSTSTSHTGRQHAEAACPGLSHFCQRRAEVFGLPPHLRPPHRRLILPHAACFGADFPDPDPQTRIVIRIADEGHRLARTLPRSREWNDPTTGNWTDLDERLLEPIVVQHAPPQADQISFFNSSRIGPLTTTDEAGLSDGISFLEWTLNNINCENFAGLNQALAATSVFYGSDLASLITPKLIQALDGAAMSSASTAAIFSLLARLPKEDFVGQALEKLAIASGLMASKTQARKAIEAGTIQLNGTRIPPKSHQRTISEADLLDRRLVVIKAGKTAHKAVLLE